MVWQEVVLAGYDDKKRTACDFLVVYLLCRNYLPFQIIESPMFKAFVYSLNSNYRLPTRATVSFEMVLALAGKINTKIGQYAQNMQDVCLEFRSVCRSTGCQQKLTCHSLDTRTVDPRVRRHRKIRLCACRPAARGQALCTRINAQFSQHSVASTCFFIRKHVFIINKLLKIVKLD
jgi:hypothetical protein